VLAHPTVNVDEAVAVGDMILTEMNGTRPSDYTFHKKKQAVTLGLKSSSVNIDEDGLQIDALFDSSLLLNEANKPALADVMWKMSESGVSADIPDRGI